MKIAVLYACFTLYDYTAGFAALYEVVSDFSMSSLYFNEYYCVILF